MDDIKRIPVPPAQRWREFRISLLPWVVFALAALTIAVLWKQVVSPAAVVGEVATVQYLVRSLTDGTLQNLTVEPFSFVRKGEVIGTILPVELTNTLADIAVAVSSLELERLRTGMNVNRNLLELSTLELSRLQVMADSELAKADLAVKRVELDRTKELLRIQQSSQVELEVKTAAYERAKTVVEQLVVRLKGYEDQLKSYRAGQQVLDMHGQSDAVDKAIVAKTNFLMIASRALPMIAPADGIITSLGHRSGEKVRAGETIAALTETNITYIVGYMRQPIIRMPKVNDDIQVRTRGNSRLSAGAKVLKVGAQFDFMNPALVTPDNTRHEKAISFMVSIPTGLALKPGEFVDLAFGN